MRRAESSKRSENPSRAPSVHRRTKLFGCVPLSETHKRLWLTASEHMLFRRRLDDLDALAAKAS
jgi:hypothetical protein